MKILINALSGIGDALMFTPALKLLHNKLPNYKIDMLVMFPSVQDLFRASPYVNNIYFVDFINQSKFKSMKDVYDLKQNDYFMSFNVYPSNRFEYNLINYLLGAKKRFGHNYLNSAKFNLSFLNNVTVNEQHNIHNVLQNINLVRKVIDVKDTEIGGLVVNVSEDDENCAALWLNRNSVNVKNPIIGFHAGSSTIKNHINKRWDKDKFAALGNKLIEIYDATILLFGLEEDLNNEINRELKYKGILASTSNYMDSMARLKLCDLFVTNDTTFLHSASALKIPVVAIFGYTNYNELYPWKTEHIIVRKELECSPCFFNSPKPAKCKWKGNDEFKCIKTIDVNEVFTACNKLLINSKNPRLS